MSAGADAITALVERTVSPPPVETTAVGANAARPIGAIAPALKLRDLDGTKVDLGTFRGRETLVPFWNPACGFFQRMLPDLKRWEEAETPGVPRLVLVSTGEVEANRAMGLRSPVVLDEAFAAGRAFGTGGTPSAVLADAAGRIASPVAVGAQAVLALAAPIEVKITDTWEPVGASP